MQLKYLQDNNFEFITQPANAFVKVNPFELGNFTYNNKVYDNIETISTINAKLNNNLPVIIDTIATENIIKYNIKFTKPQNVMNNLTASIGITQLNNLMMDMFTLTSVQINDEVKEYNITNLGINVIDQIVKDFPTIFKTYTISNEVCNMELNEDAVLNTFIINTEGNPLQYINGNIISINDSQYDIINTVSINSIYSGICRMNSVMNGYGSVILISNSDNFVCDCEIVKIENVI